MTARLVRGVGCVTLALLLACVVLRAVVRERDPDWTAPPESANRINPLVGRTELAAGGGKVFQQRCAQCHGPTGEGTTKAPDLSQAGVQDQSDGALFWKITTGNGYAGMPTFSRLPETQRWQLVLFLRTLKRS